MKTDTSIAPPADWTEVKAGNQYTPPGDEIVWTTDGALVGKGRFLFDRDTFEARAFDKSGADYPDSWKVPGQWVDEAGAEIAVTHWLGLDEWKGDFPPPTPRPKPRRA